MEIKGKEVYNEIVYKEKCFVIGYVRCQTEEMLVKHHRLYQAIYCGLCHSIKKNIGIGFLPYLSYDFVFLAVLRMLSSKQTMELEKQFCLLHPFAGKKIRMKDNPSLLYASVASLALCYEKIQDDRNDRDISLFRRLLFALYTPYLRRKIRHLKKQDPRWEEIFARTALAMKKGREAEEKNASLDEMCALFGECLSVLFSYGFEEKQSRILASLGEMLGKFIYTLDALDDWQQDEKSNAFNPFIRRYGAFENAGEVLPEIDLVLSFYIQKMKLALDLLEGDSDLFCLCDHIITRGLSGSVQKCIKPKMGEKQ